MNYTFAGVLYHFNMANNLSGNGEVTIPEADIPGRSKGSAEHRSNLLLSVNITSSGARWWGPPYFGRCTAAESCDAPALCKTNAEGRNFRFYKKRTCSCMLPFKIFNEIWRSHNLWTGCRTWLEICFPRTLSISEEIARLRRVWLFRLHRKAIHGR